MTSWPPKPGDWVTMRGQPQPMQGDAWDPRDPSEPQPGCTYRVDDTESRDQLVWLECLRKSSLREAFVSWLRPASPEEIAQAQLSSHTSLEDL